MVPRGISWVAGHHLYRHGLGMLFLKATNGNRLLVIHLGNGNLGLLSL